MEQPETEPRLPVLDKIQPPEKKPGKTKPAIPALKTGNRISVQSGENSPKIPANQKPETERKDDNVIYIGKKGVMGYVLAVVTNFNRGSSEVIIKARGAMISVAVDVEEITKRKFIPGLKVKEVRLMSERMQSRNGQPSNVPGIEIVLTK